MKDYLLAGAALLAGALMVIFAIVLQALPIAVAVLIVIGVVRAFA